MKRCRDNLQQQHRVIYSVVAGSRYRGLLRQPSEGQSLLSFLSSQDFHTCTDLDRV